MAPPAPRYRDRALLPRLGGTLPKGPLLLDTNVFINALGGRGPAELRTLLASLPRAFISGPVVAELSWTYGRLDPDDPRTALVLERYRQALDHLAPAQILIPDADDWPRAGRLAGAAARAVAGPTRSPLTATDRAELIHDALTALVAVRAGATIVTSDSDFDLFMQLEPGLEALFYG
ncbi:MAG: PIN domain-containing protein [Allosphingosinicella sp.]